MDSKVGRFKWKTPLDSVLIYIRTGWRYDLDWEPLTLFDPLGAVGKEIFRCVTTTHKVGIKRQTGKTP